MFEDLNNHPYDNSSFLSRWSFFWLIRLNKITPKEIDESSLILLPLSLNTQAMYSRLTLSWNQQKQKSSPSFLRAIIRAQKQIFIRIFLFLLLGQTFPLCSILFLGPIIISFDQSDTPLWYSICLVTGFVISLLMTIQFVNLFYFWFSVYGNLIKTVGTQLIFQKLLKIKFSSLLGCQQGKIINLAAKDMESFFQVTRVSSILTPAIICPIQIMLLYYFFGFSGLVGVVIAILNLVLLLCLTKVFKLYWKDTAVYADNRQTLVSDIISGIKILKFNNWEKQYTEQNLRIREEQIKVLRKVSNVRLITQVIYLSTQIVVVVITYWLYVTLGGQLRLDTTFVGISLMFHIIEIIAGQLPAVVEALGVSFSASERITKTLLLPDKPKQTLKNFRKIKIQKLTSSWKEEKESFQQTDPLLTTHSQNVLNEVSLDIQEGELVVVLGKIGAGKTSLLMSLLEELDCKKGNISIGKSVAYVQQVPWILTQSIKSNILMDSQQDSQFYKKTIESCCLVEDLNYMTFGDKSMIGEKGITLSGGQKARLSLARAVYSRKQIYLLDDPLSSVDSSIASSLFFNCINGILKHKTRVLVTHQEFVLQYADKIVVLQEGRIIFKGNKEQFLEFQETHDSFYNRTSKETLQEKQKDVKTIIEEQRETGEVPFSSYLQFFLESFKSKTLIIVFVVFCVLVQFPIVYSQIWISIWVESEDQSDPIYVQILLILLGSIVCGLCLRTYIYNYNVISSCKQTYNKAIKSVSNTFPVFFDSNPSGRIINRFSRDTYYMDFILPNWYLQLFQYLFFLLGYLTAMIIFVPYNLVSLVLTVPIIYKLRKSSVEKARDLRRIQAVTRSPIFTLINQCVNGLIQIRCFQWEQYFIQKFWVASNLNIRANFHYLSLARYYQFFTDFSMILILTVNAYIIGLWLGFETPSNGALTLTFSISIIIWTRSLNRALFEVDISMVSVQRLQRYSQLPPEETLYQKELLVTKGEILFQNVCMRYRPHLDLILKNMSFKIEGGEWVGVVGRTGAGKSSIVQCLFRMISLQSGSILIDNQDIHFVSLESLRSQIGIIPQVPFLFNCSLRKNLDPQNIFSDSQIRRSLQECGLDSYFKKYTLESDIRSSSLQLSVGQKQLLCLCRVTLRRNKIIVMDEPTANVDNNTDKMMQKILKTKFSSSTVLCIAHRIASIIKSDKILVVWKGNLKEMGSPRELLEDEESTFYNMVKELGSTESSRMINLASSS